MSGKPPPEKSIYIVFAHGDEALVGFNEEDPMAARPTVPADTEIILFEHCGSALPSSIDCPLMKLFMDGSPAGRKLLEEPYHYSHVPIIKAHLGVRPRPYLPGQKHPEISLTLQSSWNEGKGTGAQVYSITKSGTYKYPLTPANFPKLRTGSIAGAAESIHNDPICNEYVSYYDDSTYKTVIPAAFKGSVFPTPSQIFSDTTRTQRRRIKGAYMVPPILLSNLIQEIKAIDPNPAIIYVVTCRTIPTGMRNIVRYHKGLLESILERSPKRNALPKNTKIDYTKKNKLEVALTAVPKSKAKASRRAAPKLAAAPTTPSPPPTRKNRTLSWHEPRERMSRRAKKEAAASRRTRKSKRWAMSPSPSHWEPSRL